MVDARRGKCQIVGVSWFNRKADLLSKLLDIEAQKAEMRSKIEMRRLELENETLEARAKADLELREWKAERRERARQLGLKNAATRKRRANGQFPGPDTCELCDDPMRRDVSKAMIEKHRAHEAGGVSAPTIGVPSELGN